VASKTIVHLVDDITGKDIPAGQGETIEFSVNGTSYTIDLDAKGAKKFHDTLALYTGHAQRIGRTVPRAARRQVATDVEPAAVRAWAKSHKIQVNARGRIAAAVIAKYKAAGN
jgi:hypothetical protein